MLRSDGWHSFKPYIGRTAFMSLSRRQQGRNRKVMNMKVILKIGTLQRLVMFFCSHFWLVQGAYTFISVTVSVMVGSVHLLKTCLPQPHSCARRRVQKSIP